MSGKTLETVSIEDLEALEQHDPTVTIRVEIDEEEDAHTPIEGASSLESTVVLGGLLGRGGMAVVREAEQRALGRRVAVKSAHVETQGVGNRLVQEAQITGALEHPSIVPVHDILLDADGRPHIVLQRVHGDAWETLIDDADAVEKRFGTRDLLGWNLGVLESVCNAMHFAHQEGIVHRDLKPDNVMIGGFGQVYVLDWGVAVSVRDDETRFPRASEQRRIVGTPRYMAPEMLTGDGRVGACTDIYLLGALLYRILAGRPPHRGFSIKDILRDIPAFVPEIEGAPEELMDLVRDSMAVSIADRPSSAEVFRRRLHAFVEHRGAVELVEQAEQTLRQLEALLADEDADRVHAYDLFGACRFGFRGALDTWENSDAAADGLERATMAMASWELENGDDRAAEVLLASLADVPSSLTARLTSLRERRLADLGVIQRMARDRDPRTGQRIRLGAIAVFSGLWTVSPWLVQAGGAPVRLGLSALWLGILVILLVAGGKDWVRSSVNRRTLKLLSLALASQFVLIGGAAMGVMPMDEARAALLVVNAAFVGLAAVFLDKRFWVPAVAFTLVFFSRLVVPDWGVPLRSGATLLLGVVAAWIWWPSMSRPSTR